MSDITAYITAILSVLYSSLSLIGIVGNLWVLWLLFGQLAKQSPTFKRVTSITAATAVSAASTQSLRRQTSVRSMRENKTSTHWYLILLSTTDLLHMCMVPMLVVDINWEWRFGKIGCKTFFVGETANKILSPLILAGLSYDRYSVVCAQGWLGIPWLKITLIAFLLMCMCAALPMMFIIVYYAQLLEHPGVGDEKYTKCNVEIYDERYYVFIDLVQFVFCFVLPLSVICMVYVAILIRLYTHRKSSCIEGRSAFSIGRVARCSAMLVVFYFACWTPYYLGQAYRLTSGLYEYESDNVTHVEVETPIGEEVEVEQVQQEDYEDSEAAPSSPMGAYIVILISYMSHSLPYAQAAFNWLLYVYLNRSLRQSPTSTLGGPTPSMISNRSIACNNAVGRGVGAQQLEMMSNGSCAVPLINGTKLSNSSRHSRALIRYSIGVDTPSTCSNADVHL